MTEYISQQFPEFHEDDNLFSRRDLFKIVGSATLASALPIDVFASSTNAAGSNSASSGGSDSQVHHSLADPIYFSSVGALSQAIQKKQVSSEEVVRACLERIKAVNPKLNAVVQQNQEDSLLALARKADAALARGENWGPLHGVPMTIKDSFDTVGLISTGGTLGRKNFVPTEDATVVKRLREAGAILLGKTNTPEFTLSFETDNLVYGKTNNPYDITKSPGGSSGGAAAIIAAGGSPFDIGSDLGGSIRFPAHLCGIAGIKPTSGRVPRTGHIYPFGGLQDNFQQVGPLARYVDDLALLLPIIMGPDWIDPSIMAMPWRDPATIDITKLRVSFHTDNGVVTPTPETMQTVSSVAKSLADAKIAVEEVRPTGIEETFTVGWPFFLWDSGAGIKQLLKKANTVQHSPPLQGVFDSPSLSVSELDQLITRWYEWRSKMLMFMKNYDVILSPANASPDHPHGLTKNPDNLPIYSYTLTHNLTGWPGVVVRAGTSPEGMPIGVQIVARPGREDVALAVAKFIETKHGGYQRPSI
ncbi:Amidase [Beggiatoa sp. PS]|nr:Amidase [Beggiatoa sp. PS]